MNRLQFKIDINASAQEVYETMLGLKDKSTYEKWASAFDPSSTYIGTWNTSNKIYFLGTDENGRRGGIISKVVVHVPNEFVSLQVTGIVDGDNEIYKGPEVEKWLHAHENYRFVEEMDRTTLTVEMEVPDDHVQFYNDTFPVGLKRLKRLVEG